MASLVPMVHNMVKLRDSVNMCPGKPVERMGNLRDQTVPMHTGKKV